MKTVALAIALALPLATLAETKPAPAPAPAAAPDQAAATTVEKKLMAERADLVAKNLTLTADQAAKFWPLYEKYQAGFSELLAKQLDSVKAYVMGYDKLDDAGAVALITAQMDRDAAVAAYRQKWFPEFQKVLPGKLAAKFMQIDRRLSLVTQVQIISQIPVIQ